eukprot:snap_masked-scaffold1035_size68272-processed-gene-0.8 protein:Tk07534 transcript:snap_masked-scaffold1035_size68272-processed-gene-0.8-mRNA-1 annotation:"hypothetical protein TcasGA2_TC010755"
MVIVIPILELSSPRVLKMVKLELVPELEVMSREEMMAEHWNLVRLARRTITVEQMACPPTALGQHECVREMPHTAVNPGRLQCPRQHQVALPPVQQLEVDSTWVLHWCKNFLEKDCHEESSGMAKDIQIGWANFHSDLCAQHLLENPTVIGGVREDENGTLTPVIVEIDESLLAKTKYNRGRWPEQRWVLGGVECQTGHCFMVEAPD